MFKNGEWAADTHLGPGHLTLYIFPFLENSTLHLDTAW